LVVNWVEGVMVVVVWENSFYIQRNETGLEIPPLEKENFSILETMELFDLDMVSKVWDTSFAVGWRISMGLRGIGFVVGFEYYTHDSNY